jgi:hypothetical protein
MQHITPEMVIHGDLNIKQIDMTEIPLQITFMA